MKRHASMNRIYRLVWSRVHESWVAVAETARGRGKGSSRKLVAAALSLCAAVAQAAPTGGQLVSGAGSISQSGATTTITQSSQNLSLNWRSFNIAPAETVNFQQPNAAAIAVNRIFDTSGTQILGHLNANGQVWLINPNGILFGQGAQVNVGGLIASTLDFNDSTLNGNARSFAGPGTGSVINRGTINAADGGYVALLGNHVGNQGTISARLGTVALGAGSGATLSFAGNSLVKMQVDQSVLNSMAENGGLIRADGGMVVMNAGAKNALLASVVNNTGVIEARTVENREGVITLLGGMTAGQVNVGGTLDASAPNGGSGGFIETSAARVKVANDAKVTTAAAMGLYGTWLIDPVDFTIAAGSAAQTTSGIGASTLSGNLGGGSVSIATSAATAGNGDIFVNAAVSWAANKLTLSAHRNIDINADLNGSGSASLALEYGQGAVAAGNSSNYNVRAPVNLPAGNNFSTKLGSNGATVNYTVVTSLGAAGDATTGPATLQGMAATANLAGNYALGSNIDAAATSTWNTNAGFAPIGNSTNNFTGAFDGLGHTISNLAINRSSTDYIGMFGITGSGSGVRNAGLVGGSVKGGSYVGGLVGQNGGSVRSSYFTGSVTGGAYKAGGLVGTNYGTVSNSYATGNVSGTLGVGGLVGTNFVTVENSYYTTGSVSGASYVGGLVGQNGGSVSNSYATGSVSGSDRVGGLVGHSYGSVSNSYATGSVSGSSYIGGLVGCNFSYGVFVGTVSNGHWNRDVNPIGIGGGAGTTTATTGLTTLEMQQQSNFSSWNFANTWIVYNGFTNPLLRSFMTPLTVTANDAGKAYDRLAFSGGNGVSYSSAPNANLLGAVSYSGTSQGATNAGSYAITPGGLYSNQQGYIVSYANGTLTVNKAVLTASVAAPDKVYDGNTTATPTLSITGGLVGTETVSASGTASFNTKNVATANLVTVNSTALSDGSNGGLAGNYSLAAGQTVAANITAKALTASVAAPNKVYDGNTTAAPTLSITGGLVGIETVSASGTASFNTKDVATANLVTVNSTALTDGSNGGLAGNFSLAAGQTVAANITAKALTASVAAPNKVYDGNTTAAPTLSITGGLVNTETVTATGTASFNTKDVATANLVTVNSTALSDGSNGGLAGNYSLAAGQTVAANITAANLAVTGVTASNKVYDATTAATLGGTATIAAIGADVINLDGSGTGVFADKNVGTGKAVTVSGFTLSGADAGNYNLVQQTGLTADITQADLAVTGLTAGSKVYDATRTATLGGAAAITKLGTDDVSVGGSASGLFDTKNVGVGKAITVSGNTISGADASNYNLLQQTGLTADVTVRKLYVTGLSASDKVYDGTNTALLGGTAAITQRTGDDVILGGSASGAFLNKNVGTNKAVIVSGNTISGADAGNYDLVQQIGLRASITPLNLAVAGTTTASNKMYDATTTAMLTGGSLSGVIPGDTVTLTQWGTFASKNVGMGIAVTATDKLHGASAGNYTLTQPTGLTADITVRKLYVTGLSASGKVYDGTAIAPLGGAAAITPRSGDDVTVGGSASGAFGSKNIGTNRVVTVSGNTISGADAGNYDLVQQIGLRASITPLNLAVAGTTTASNKMYDATTTAMLTGGSLSGVIPGDTVTLTQWGTFASKNVGMGIAVTATDKLHGVSAGNYTLTQPTGLTADITARKLYVTGLRASDKVYDATATALLGGTAAITQRAGDDVILGGSASGAFGSKNIGTNRVVTVSGNTISGADAGNYDLVQQIGLRASVTPLNLTLTGTTVANNKMYDATTTAMLTGGSLSGVLSGDDVTLTQWGTFASKNVGMGIAVTATDKLHGVSARNYTLTQPTGLTADITVRNLYVTGLTAYDKVYDGTTIAPLGGAAAITQRAGDDVILGGSTSGAFLNKNVGTNKAVIVSGNTISGADAGNYNLVQQIGLRASILPPPD